MGTETTSLVVHPEGEQPEIEGRSAVADTYAGRVHVEWDATAPVKPFGQLLLLAPGLAAYAATRVRPVAFLLIEATAQPD